MYCCYFVLHYYFTITIIIIIIIVQYYHYYYYCYYYYYYKVWDSLLQYTENSCKSVVMKDDWTNILKTVIESRVSKISDNKVVIQLFLNLEKSHAKLHQIIDDAITSQVIKPLEQQFKSDQVCYNIV